MENFRLKVFRTVAERLNFTQAADALHLTQPAVTLQIKALEESLGLGLFDRTGSRVVLTKAGELLLQHAREVDELTIKTQTELGKITGEERGRLALGASTTIAQYILPPLVGKFLATRPRVDPFLYGANTENVVNSLIEKRVDLAFIEGPPHRGDLKSERFIADVIVAIIHPEDEWSQPGCSITATDLERRPLILRERGSGTRTVVELALKKAGLNMRKLKIAMELDSSEAIKCAVEAGLGIGFVSEWALRKERQLGTLGILPISGMQMSRHLNLVRAQGPESTGVAGSFLQFARDHGRALSPFPPATYKRKGVHP